MQFSSGAAGFPAADVYILNFFSWGVSSSIRLIIDLGKSLLMCCCIYKCYSKKILKFITWVLIEPGNGNDFIFVITSFFFCNA